MRGTAGINLASQPFRRDRPFLVAALAGSVLLAGLLAMQIGLGWVHSAERRELLGAVETMEAQLARLRAERAALEQNMRKPENAEALDYAVFLNGLLLRKGISWTRIFGDLEQVLPHSVRVMSVRPQVNADNQIQLDMTVAAQSPEPVIQLLMKLESSDRFGATQVASWLPPTQTEPLYRYRVNVNYAPQY